MFVSASTGSLLISLLHVAIPLLGPWAYGYFGAAELMPAAQSGSLYPALITWMLAGYFAAVGIYGLSAAGLIRRLPGTRPVVAFAGSIYALRGLLLIPELSQLVQGTLHPQRRAVFSAASLILGLLYLLGFIFDGKRDIA